MFLTRMVVSLLLSLPSAFVFVSLVDAEEEEEEEEAERVSAESTTPFCSKNAFVSCTTCVSASASFTAALSLSGFRMSALLRCIRSAMLDTTASLYAIRRPLSVAICSTSRNKRRGRDRERVAAGEAEGEGR